MINATFDLFDKLGATEEQLDFPVVYASGLNGWASLTEGTAGEPWGEHHARAAVRRGAANTCRRTRATPEAPLQLQISLA